VNHEDFPFTSGSVIVTFEPAEGRLDEVDGSIIGVDASGLTLQSGFTCADWLPWSVIRHVQIRGASEKRIRAIADRLARPQDFSFGATTAPVATLDAPPPA